MCSLETVGTVLLWSTSRGGATCRAAGEGEQKHWRGRMYSVDPHTSPGKYSGLLWLARLRVHGLFADLSVFQVFTLLLAPVCPLSIATGVFCCFSSIL